MTNQSSVRLCLCEKRKDISVCVNLTYMSNLVPVVCLLKGEVTSHSFRHGSLYLFPLLLGEREKTGLPLYSVLTDCTCVAMSVQLVGFEW